MGRAGTWRWEASRSVPRSLPQAPASPRTMSSWLSTGRACTSWTSRNRCSWSCPSLKSQPCPAVGQSQPSSTLLQGRAGKLQKDHGRQGTQVRCPSSALCEVRSRCRPRQAAGEGKGSCSFPGGPGPLRESLSCRGAEGCGALSWSCAIEQFVLHCVDHLGRSLLTGLEGSFQPTHGCGGGCGWLGQSGAAEFVQKKAWIQGPGWTDLHVLISEKEVSALSSITVMRNAHSSQWGEFFVN